MTSRTRLLLVALLVAIAPRIAAAQTVVAPAPPAPTFPGQWAPAPAEWKYPVWPNGCTRFDGEERLACYAFVTSDFGRLSRYADANRALAPAAPDQARVVFFGDSITDRWSQPQSGGFFPGRPYVNRGIGGQTTGQMLLRFRADVLSLSPRVVVILAGTNDLAGNAGPVTPDQLMDNLVTMTRVGQTSRHPRGPRVDPAGGRRQDRRQRPAPDPVARQAARAAEVDQRTYRGLRVDGGQVQFLDYFTAMATPAGTLRPELNDDGLHPNKAGYEVMQPLAEKAIAAALRN